MWLGYTHPMKRVPLLAVLLLPVALVLVVPTPVRGDGGAQERRTVPSDSELISIPGCARDRTFIVGESPAHEPVGTTIAAGRRFRLNGPKAILADIRKREGMMVEVTGLVRKRDLAGPGGLAIFGGRVRIGAADPRAPITGARLDPMYNQVVIDVESWRLLTESCPSR